MNANFGLLEPLAATGRISKDRKKELLVERAQAEFASWLRRSVTMQHQRHGGHRGHGDNAESACPPRASCLV